MRHRKRNIRLGRKPTNRKAALKNLARALLIKESITTTRAKAKEAQAFIEGLISIAKEKRPESKRAVFSLIRDKALIKTLFDEIAPRFRQRTGGYTRVIPLYPRRGDGAPMAILELVEKKPKVTPKRAKKEEAKRTKRVKGEEEKNIDEKAKPEKAEHKVAPEPKADIKQEIQREKAKREEKKIKKGGFFKNLRKYFRGKAP